ncbi:MAG TPA: POTRA domain-containing protein [Pyrinomonadaceae bacterium]
MTLKTSSTIGMVFPRLIPSFSVFLIIIAFAVAHSQQPGRKVAKIEIEGLERLSAEEVIATSGLKTGTLFSIEDLDAAGQRLVDSGLFAKVGYRTTSKGNQLTVIFQVEEIKGGQSPVVFDNFVWFTNDELMAAIKREVPSFDGTAADAGHMTDDIKRALQNLLKEHKIEAVVEYAPWQRGTTGAKQEHLFSVAGVPIPICQLHFPGAKNVSEEKLVKSSKQLTDADYSLKSAIAFSTFVLFPIYREVGQLRARFLEPVPKFEGATNCKGGVELSIPVEEGPIYLWDKVDWTGNEALTPSELDEALGMKNGEVAKGSRIEKGLHEVSRRYLRTGHLAVRLRPQPDFDDTASRVSYRIEVKEGPLYRMGKLTIRGLSEADSKSLEQRWKLKSGEVFNGGYLDQFFKDANEEMQRIFSGRQAQGQARPKISMNTIPNHQTLTADVIIEFKN